LEQLRDQLSPAALKHLRQVTFALLKPDAIASGKLKSAIHWLDAHGFALLDVHPIWGPEEWQFEALYQYNLTLRNEQNQISSWWINRRLYTMGPSVCLVLAMKEPQHGSCIYRTLATAKGPSNPLACSPGQLRYDLAASNLAMNLFHCADDPISSAREFLIFQSMPRLRALLDAVTNGMARALEAHARRRLDLVEAALPPALTTDPFDIAASILMRTALAEGGFEALPASLLKLADKVADTSLAARNRAFQALLRDARSELGETLPLTAALAAFPAIADSAMARLLDGLAVAGIKLSEWERLTLQTTAHYRGAFHAT
jgi:nucleoside diphosphate kinase